MQGRLHSHSIRYSEILNGIGNIVPPYLNLFESLILFTIILATFIKGVVFKYICLITFIYFPGHLMSLLTKFYSVVPLIVFQIYQS